MNKVLAAWNSLSSDKAAQEILPCNGSRTWAENLSAERPFATEPSLFKSATEVWFNLSPGDWQEAFDSHPRIGQHKPQGLATERSMRWSAFEQNSLASQGEISNLALEEANRRYETRFGRIFIVSASGKTSNEILRILEARMKNDVITELQEAVEQQAQITRIRLQDWLKQE